MPHDNVVLYSFGIFALYFLLPVVPAVVIFWLFPDTKVFVAGPFQGLKLSQSGAFAAYFVTLGLGYSPLRYVEGVISASRKYAIEGVIEVGTNEYVDSDRFYSRYVSDGADKDLVTRHYHFVLVLDHPLSAPEKVLLKYWEINTAGGTGAPPVPTEVEMKLTPTSAPEDSLRYLLRRQGDRTVVVKE